jgi:hypothetical protein
MHRWCICAAPLDPPSCWACGPWDGLMVYSSDVMPMQISEGAVLVLLCAVTVAGSCGGKAVVDRSGGGGSAAGSTTSTSGTGGSTTSSGTTVDCPSPLSCNWCGGTNVVDAQGCIVGYLCPNGVDPCETSPCVSNSDCPPGAYCSDEGLCWPCQSGTCQMGGTGPNLTCSFSTSSADGMEVSFECSTSEWGGNCDCLVGGVVYGICDIDGEPGDPCAIGFNCCDFPDPGDG